MGTEIDVEMCHLHHCVTSLCDALIFDILCRITDDWCMGMRSFFTLLCISTLECGALTVTSNSDSGPGSLRQAIADAADGDTITFAITGQIVLSGGEFLVNKNLTIVGPGSDSLALVGGNGHAASYPGDGTVSCRLFNITNS